MSELLGEIKHDFNLGDKEYRHAYADEHLNAMIATQIKVLREQRDMRQEDLAEQAEMHQPMISRYENVNYSSWSINTLKKLAFAFDAVLEVKFKSFGKMIRDVDQFSRESLQVPEFEEDPEFKVSVRTSDQEGCAVDATLSFLNSQAFTAHIPGNYPSGSFVIAASAGPMFQLPDGLKLEYSLFTKAVKVLEKSTPTIANALGQQDIPKNELVA